ncbi:nascent polypeptide-associated complex protein [Methanomicrobium antiquum]|uniref:Nascent polypeptide-associated complex protein n=1 Tax=Methanomicrobium antiquum TaxID=487686 RepID=A0AAF0JNE0_9EURY|nr:nascent polypeptide-associated complex protein [Methanomicrobium antiquum]MDD3976537.1 nascent polypeptide-associated complex protein [Methanomicrobium sp.]WFN37480.1 nascent polypeptide-associated complex protein [Methanomicrobium antiquum]
MIPGVNPKQMKQMMKKLGMKMEEVEDVERVVVYTKNGNYVFEDAEFIITTMQGTTTYQVQGTPVFEPADVEIPEDDVKMVAEQASVSEDEALLALKETNGDIAEAILKLSE